MATQIQLRRDTAANWTSNNTVLAAGEFAWESDTNKFKIGDGTTAWTALAYASDGDTAGITFVGDDSTGTLVAQNETFKIAGTQNITTAVAGDTLTITGPDLTGYSTFSGSYTDLTNKPTIPTNNNELTNGAGYITASSTDTLTNKSGNISQFTNDSGYKTAVSEADVTQHQAALSITESQISDLTHFSGSYTDLTNKPTIPTNNNELTNGAGYITASSLTGLASESYVNTQIANTVDSAPETLNTLNELAAALGDDANFATTTSTALGNRLRVDTNAQGLSTEQKTNAKTNLGLATVSSTGAYSDLSGTPTIPTNNNQLTNGAGYITDYTVTEGDVTAHQAALSITESQITDLGSYITASSTDTLTNKSGAISQWTNDSGYSTFSGSYTDLTNKPTIPTNNTELTNGAGYITGVAFADVTGKPTTIAGYGITDAFSGSYTDLTNKPTIPSALTDLSISDGTNGQVLTTDGAGGFTFTTVSGGGASTGDFTFTGNKMTTSSSNADAEIEASGTGRIFIKARGGLPSSDYQSKAGWSDSRANNANIMFYDDQAATAGSRRMYGNWLLSNYKLDGTNSSSGNARFRHISEIYMDLNGTSLTNNGNSRGLQFYHTNLIDNSSATTANLSTATGYVSSPATVNNPTGSVNINGVYAGQFNGAEYAGTADGAITNDYGIVIKPSYKNGPSGALNITNGYGLYYANQDWAQQTYTNPPYFLYTDKDSVKSNPGALNKFNEWSYNATHSSGGGYTIDWANGNLQTVTLTSNITSFTMSNFPTATTQSVGVTLYLVQDGTGGRSMTFNAGSGETFKFANGANSSSVSSANDIQVVYIFSKYNGSSNTYYWTIGPAYS